MSAIETTPARLSIKSVRVDKFVGPISKGSLPTEIVIIDETGERVLTPDDPEYHTLLEDQSCH